MTSSPIDLLRALGSGVLPSGVPAPARSIGGSAFQDLLAKAQAGAVHSGLGVTVDPDLPVSLTPEQQQRLAEAADRAQASGAKVALVRLDGQLLRLDVAERRITQVVDLKHGDVLTGIDAMVEASATEAHATIVPPPSAAPTPAMLKALTAA